MWWELKWWEKGNLLRSDVGHISFKNCNHIFLASNVKILVYKHFIKEIYSNFSLCSYISRNINVPWDQAPLSLQLQVTHLLLSLVYLCPSVLFSLFSLPHTGIQVQHLPMQNNTHRSEHHVLVRRKEDIWFTRTWMHQILGDRSPWQLHFVWWCLIFVVNDSM